MMAVAQGLDAGFDDMGRGLEIGLADGKGDDAAPLGPERIGAGEHFKGGFGPEAAHAAG